MVVFNLCSVVVLSSFTRHSALGLETEGRVGTLVPFVVFCQSFVHAPLGVLPPRRRTIGSAQGRTGGTVGSDTC